MGSPVSILAWLILLALAAKVFMAVLGNPFIDWLDERTSRITPEEAQRRAKLSLLGHWPPPPARPWSTRNEWIALTVGLLLIAGLTTLYRHWLR